MIGDKVDFCGKGVYCEGCHIKIAPFDPEHIIVDGDNWHKPCYNKQVKQLERGLINALSIPDVKLLPETFKRRY